MHRYTCYVCVALLGAAPRATAAVQLSADSAATAASQLEDEQHVPFAQAAPRDGTIDIDGRVDEAAWREAAPVTRFIQGTPIEGAASEQYTEVRVLFDEKAIYVAAVMREPNLAAIGTQLVRRDEDGQYDYFEFSLDPNNDKRTGYRFRVSAAGVQRDVYLYDDVRQDLAWDAVWESAVKRDSTGWSVEFRIPLSQIRYSAQDDEQSWGVNFTRRRLGSNELSYFALESRVSHGVVSVFGRLGGLRFPGGARRLEFRPYALTRAAAAAAVEADPFFDGSELDGQLGLDLRYGLGSDFTLDASFNPDFGQVEVDPAVINLTDFETFFPERRPFFVEDAQIFDFNLAGRQNLLYYTRRIGREPQGSAPSGSDFESSPAQTTIATAAKLTGRTPGGLSLGALGALTTREAGQSFDTTANESGEFVAEPRSLYGVVRVQQDFGAGTSLIGGVGTGMHRDLPSDGSLDFLSTDAFSLGMDFERNWGGAARRNWVLWGHVARSWVTGTKEALLDVQTSSSHYLQRPDATRFAVDSSRTSLSGLNWQVQFERRSARHWTGAIWLGESTSGFEVNDLGFWRDTERIDLGVRLGYHEINPGTFLRSYDVTVRLFNNFRHEALDDPFSLSSWKRAYKRGGLFSNTNFEFLNYWRFSLDLDYSPDKLSDTATRGGPLMTAPGTASIELALDTDRRKLLALGVSSQYRDRRQGGYSFRVGAEIAWRPLPSIEISLLPSFRSEANPAQYVATTDDVGYEPTFGRRYLFSDLERKVLGMETRLNIAFSPRLTLQFFAQPLIDAGDYVTYKQLERSESFDFELFSDGTAVVDGDDVTCVGGSMCVIDGERFFDLDGDGTTDFSTSDESFNIRSLRLNAVLRWEYRPGSTIFLVWQQNRAESVNDGSFDFGRDLTALAATDAENVLILKVNYWLGL